MNKSALLLLCKANYIFTNDGATQTVKPLTFQRQQMKFVSNTGQNLGDHIVKL